MQGLIVPGALLAEKLGIKAPLRNTTRQRITTVLIQKQKRLVVVQGESERNVLDTKKVLDIASRKK